MKNTQITNIFVVFMVLFGLMACENEPLEGEFADGPSIPGDSLVNFRVDIDSVTFVAAQAFAKTLGDSITKVAGMSSDGKNVSIIFNGSGNGTFSLTEGTAIATYLIAGDSIPFTTDFEGMTGDITITVYDTVNNLISGTFAFTAARDVAPENDTLGVEVKNFTNGTFSEIALENQ